MYSTRVFPTIVLGHNPLFGIDHLSNARGQQREQYFSSPDNVAKLIRNAFAHGARGMMMSTHERSQMVLEIIEKSPTDLATMQLYPLLPYAQKYVRAANEKGLMNVLMDAFSETSVLEKLRLATQGAKGLLSKDLLSLVANLVFMELKPFRKFNMHAVFLHDVFTDIILGLNLKDVAYFYCELIQREFGVAPAFATKNLPMFLEKTKLWGIESPLVMPHFNKVGFSMCPSLKANEIALEQYDCHVMAMSTLASGFLSPQEAYSYLGKLGHIESVVVGVSSLSHIMDTFTEIKKHMT